MSAAGKAKGTRFETMVTQFLNDNGFKAERLPRMGAKDIGDIRITAENGDVLILEAKAEKSISLPEYLRQAAVEANNYEAKYPGHEVFGAAVVKRRNAGIGSAYLVFELFEFLEFVKNVQR